MKLQTCVFALFIGCVLGVSAGPLRKDRIAGDSKWLLHIDLDNFRNSKTGRFVTGQILDKALAEFKRKSNFDLGPFIENVRSVTAYGTDYERDPHANGILLVQADAEVVRIVEGMLAAQTFGGRKVSVTQLENTSTPLYSIEQELFLGLEPGNLLVIGKSRDQIKKARAVLAGSAGNVASTESFSELLPKSNAFFFLAVASGLGDSLNAPPQAKVLQMADGGRLTLGETGENIFLELALRAKEQAVVGQIQAVVQGMIALASLSQAENQELQRLVQGVNVSAKQNIVTISLRYPVDEAFNKLESEMEERSQPRKNGGLKEQTN